MMGQTLLHFPALPDQNLGGGQLEGPQDLRTSGNSEPPRRSRKSGSEQNEERRLRGDATAVKILAEVDDRSYGFSTGSRTAFPHSVHDPS